MPWAQSDLDALDAAIKTGARSVRVGERQVMFHSLDEMLKLRAVMKESVAAQAGARSGRCSLAVFSKE